MNKDASVIQSLFKKHMQLKKLNYSIFVMDAYSSHEKYKAVYETVLMVGELFYS